MFTKKLFISSVVSILLIMILVACGSDSTARIVDQVDTATSFASADGGQDQFSVAMSEFASSFSADFATQAGSQINALYKGTSEGVSASIDVFGVGFDSASVAAEDASQNFLGSVEDASINASITAYKEAFATAFATAYAAEYSEAASLAARAMSADISSSLAANVEALDEGFAGSSVDVDDGGMFSAAIEEAYSSAYGAASRELPEEGASNSAVLWLASIALLGAGFAIGQWRKQQAE